MLEIYGGIASSLVNQLKLIENKRKIAVNRKKLKNKRVRKHVVLCSLNLRNNQSDCPQHHTDHE